MATPSRKPASQIKSRELYKLFFRGFSAQPRQLLRSWTSQPSLLLNSTTSLTHTSFTFIHTPASSIRDGFMSFYQQSTSSFPLALAFMLPITPQPQIVSLTVRTVCSAAAMLMQIPLQCAMTLNGSERNYRFGSKTHSPPESNDQRRIFSSCRTQRCRRNLLFSVLQ